MSRTARTAAVLATLVGFLACQTVHDPLPAQATLDFDLTDSMVSGQRTPLPAPQVVSWRVDAASITGIGGAPYSFLYSGACLYQLNAAFPVSFAATCRTSGLALSPDTTVTSASLSVTISQIEARTAQRPDLSPSADPDGDGIPNSNDNCPIIYNPDQTNTNLSDETVPVGDACSDPDEHGLRTIPDQDQDNVPDASDNCLWYPSPAPPGASVPADVNRNGIGDVCERVAPVVLPGGSVTLQCDGITVTVPGGKVSLLRMDFGQTGVLTCDAGFTGCTLDPSAVRVLAVGTGTSFPCHQVP